MKPIDQLRLRVQRAGFKLGLAGGVPTFNGSGVVMPADLLAELKSNKPALIESLRIWPFEVADVREVDGACVVVNPVNPAELVLWLAGLKGWPWQPEKGWRGQVKAMSAADLLQKSMDLEDMPDVAREAA